MTSHPPLNVKNRTIFCRDNIDVLRGINSDCIDLVYLDPPFNKKKTFSAPIGSSAEGAEFHDIFREEDIKDEWVEQIEQENFELSTLLAGIKNFSNKYNYCYCVYMAIRLVEIYRILKPTGSVYLHCDPTMSHYLKLILDCVFGEENFRNEIIWSYRTGGNSRKVFSEKHDVILFYSKTDKYTFNTQKEKSYTKSESRKPGVVNYGGGDAEFFQDKQGVYNLINARDVWDISYIGSTSPERTGYPTQKPIALLERIIEASSNEWDVVLDPFCGCATTCVAAEKLKRNWVGIDVSHKAYELVKLRLEKEVTGDLLKHGDPNFTTAPPKRTDDVADGTVHGYIYIISNKAFKRQLKIGIARDPEARLNNYQTSDPERGYKLEKFLQTKYNAQIEDMIHTYYGAPNEWVATGDVDEVFDLIQKYNQQLEQPQ